MYAHRFVAFVRTNLRYICTLIAVMADPDLVH